MRSVWLTKLVTMHWHNTDNALTWRWGFVKNQFYWSNHVAKRSTAKEQDSYFLLATWQLGMHCKDPRNCLLQVYRKEIKEKGLHLKLLGTKPKFSTIIWVASHLPIPLHWFFPRFQISIVWYRDLYSRGPSLTSHMDTIQTSLSWNSKSQTLILQRNN